MVRSPIEFSHELLSAALAHLGEGVMITDNNLERPGPLILYANPAMCRISGYSADELQNQSPRVLQGPDTDKSVLATIKRELTAGRTCTVELINYRKNGEPFDVELFLSPMYDSKGTCTNYVSIVRDVTERKRLAAALHARDQHLNAVLNTAVDAIVTIDHRGIIVSANRATGELFHYEQDELLGQNVSLLMPEPYRRDHDKYLKNYLSTGHAKVIGIGRELTGRKKDGTVFPIDLVVAEVEKSRLFTGIIRDLTARRELQKQVLEVAGEQQRRIGYHLHEGIGQDLTGIHLLSATLDNLINSRESGNSPPADGMWLSLKELNQMRAVVARLTTGIADALKNVKELASGIMPVQLDSEGLMVALRQLCTDTTRRSGLPCVLHCSFVLQVQNNTVAAHLYRIVKEVIDEAARRPTASRIDLHIDLKTDELVIRILDNAHPAVPNGVKKADPVLQLSSDVMQYRAGLIGASLDESLLQPYGHCTLLRLNSRSLRGD